MTKNNLLVAPCDYKAAKYAVMNWHYSKAMPTPPLVKYGVWERKRFIGCVLFGRGANMNLGKSYNLEQTEICELARVALTNHDAQVSKIVSLCLRKIRKDQAMRLCVSYADTNVGHLGIIYQAMNWIYVGKTSKDKRLRLPNGKVLHSRQFSANGYRRQYGELRKVPTPKDGQLFTIEGKHKYIYPLDRAMRRQVTPLSKPYPKGEKK